jgi:VTC domain
LQAVLNLLSTFNPITLAEMEGVKLMDRTDTKYTFAVDDLIRILPLVKDKYKILVVENARINRYETLYYDTPELTLYHQHQAGKRNRYKVRHRTYIESEIGFLEVKFKNNKGRTFKTRIKENAVCYTFSASHDEFLQRKTPYNANDLTPMVWVNYSRITLVNTTSAERLTIDLNLEFKNETITQLHPKLVIAEVKQDGKAYSPFIALMKELHLREGSISKYCLAIARIYPTVKQNNFKPKLHNLKHLLTP